MTNTSVCNFLPSLALALQEIAKAVPGVVEASNIFKLFIAALTITPC